MSDKNDNQVLGEFARTTESSEDKGTYKFPGNNNSDQVMVEVNDEETSVNDLPPSLNFKMYKHFFPKNKCYVLLDKVWKATWLAKFAAQFNFGIADANLSECLAFYQSDFETAFSSFTTTATSPTQNTATYFYSFDGLDYRAKLETIAFKTPRGGSALKHALNLRLFNNGFLYPPSNQLILKVGGTVQNHDWHLLEEVELTKFPSALLFAQTILGTSDRPLCFLFYHEDEQRMDLKFRNEESTRYVNVQFEPGYPVLDFTDDLWY